MGCHKKKSGHNCIYLCTPVLESEAISYEPNRTLYTGNFVLRFLKLDFEPSPTPVIGKASQAPACEA